ncbi:hypothetical protein D9M70_397740 [compost metagenome]
MSGSCGKPVVLAFSFSAFLRGTEGDRWDTAPALGFSVPRAAGHEGDTGGQTPVGRISDAEPSACVPHLSPAVPLEGDTLGDAGTRASIGVPGVPLCPPDFWAGAESFEKSRFMRPPATCAT